LKTNQGYTAAAGLAAVVALMPFCCFEINGSRNAAMTLGIMVSMVVLWVTNAIPAWATSLIPFMLLPLMGITGKVKGSNLSSVMMNDGNFLFVLISLLGIAIVKTNLHKRIALSILSMAGSKPRYLYFGFFFATWFLSMWISNTGTVTLMVPIAIAAFEEAAVMGLDISSPAMLVFRRGLVHGLAYSANIGGLGTVIGTSTNLVLQEQQNNLFPEGPSISFGVWMAFGFPCSFALLIFLWLFMSFAHSSKEVEIQLSAADLDFSKQLRALGPTGRSEKIVLASLIVSVCLLFFKDPGFIDGYTKYFPEPTFLTNTSVLLLPLLPLFFVQIEKSTKPVRVRTSLARHSIIMMDKVAARSKACQEKEDGETWGLRVEEAGRNTIMRTSITTEEDKDDEEALAEDVFILDEGAIQKVGWGVVLLVGGGFAIAEGFIQSGLADWIGMKLSKAGEGMPLPALLLVICLLTSAVTEFVSNSPTAAILIPAVSKMAVELNYDPRLLLVPVVMSCSLSFCLPTSTPPNAIAFSSGLITIPQMIKAGCIFDVVCVVVLVLCWLLFGTSIYGIDSSAGVPDWANNTKALRLL
jgi:sodium-dependent dicarboxylate transporter 2/3/5